MKTHGTTTSSLSRYRNPVRHPSGGDERVIREQPPPTPSEDQPGGTPSTPTDPPKFTLPVEPTPPVDPDPPVVKKPSPPEEAPEKKQQETVQQAGIPTASLLTIGGISIGLFVLSQIQ
jgi:hypothetical protein